METPAPRYGALSSSTDPTQVANTVKGIIVALSGLLLVVLPLAGISVTAEQLTTLAGNVGIAAGALWTLYGLGMKAVAHFTKQTTV